MKNLLLKFILVSSFTSFSAIASECVQSGNSVPIYQGAPKCCKGLILETPENNLLGFAGSCEKSSKRNPSNTNQRVKKPQAQLTLFGQSSK